MHDCPPSSTPALPPPSGPAAAGDYDYLPFFYSRIFHLSWQLYGTSAGTEVRHFGDFEAGKFGAIFVKDGQVSHLAYFSMRDGRQPPPHPCMHNSTLGSWLAHRKGGRCQNIRPFFLLICLA